MYHLGALLSINFINIIWAAFAPISLCKKIPNTSCNHIKLRKPVSFKKLLVKCWWNCNLLTSHFVSLSILRKWCISWPLLGNENCFSGLFSGHESIDCFSQCHCYLKKQEAFLLNKVFSKDYKLVLIPWRCVTSVWITLLYHYDLI